MIRTAPLQRLIVCASRFETPDARHGGRAREGPPAEAVREREDPGTAGHDAEGQPQGRAQTHD